MTKAFLRLAMLLICTAPAVGCSSWNLGPWGGPAYTLDTEKIGTGQQAITPRNDAFYQNGEPMDYRSRR